ncbi:MAG TPA: TIGR00725 family protein [Anaerolineales bacterium]|nr:TIGR00725 family protein [Anaerolineales bacterium]
MKPRPRVVSVAGGSTCPPQEAALAEEVGRRLAEAGAILVCGGGGGVMEAACRGAVDAGGWTVGFLPGAEQGQGNAYLSLAVPTGLGEGRNVLVVRAGQALIAIGGGYGTLSEIALGLKIGRRVVGLSTWTATTPLGEAAGILQAHTPEETVTLALAAADQ